jgi:CBS domain containing-hemolysin-like protein
MTENFFYIFLAFLLVILNGFFVAAEFSLVKLRGTRVRAIAKSLGWRGRILKTVHHNLDAYLSACQLGITLASLGLGWIGEPAFAAILEPFLAYIGIVNPTLVHTIAFVIAFFTISYLHIVLGELVPKTLAIRTAEKVGLWTAPPLYGFYWLMFPAIWMLNKSANLVIKTFNLNPGGHQDVQYNAEEIKLILRSSRPSQQFDVDEWRVLAQAIDFRELDLADLMHPANEMISLKAQDDFNTQMQTISTHQYTRYPYILEDGSVIGIVHSKDLLMALAKDRNFSDVKSLVRPIEALAPDTPATTLFRKLKNGAPHFTIVAYDRKEPIGFITMDNLLSALVGDIRDEFIKSHTKWIKMDDGSFMGKGTLSLHTLERKLGIDIESEEADTVAGLILWKLTDIPKKGDRIEFDQFSIVVKKMIGSKISLVRVYPKETKASTKIASHH